ncbi:MAG: ribonuclease III [Candidatus Berkiella sp.]
MKSISSLQKQIQYSFENQKLLLQALTHKSANSKNNERLEYLGDAILNFIIADLLYLKFPYAKEGELTRRRANLVNGRALGEKARHFGLGEYLQLGTGEKLSGGFRRESILANCFEALLGALYLDGGYLACREKIETWFADELENELKTAPEKDAKTVLQEWLQAQQKSLPVYQVINIEGPQHEQIFSVQLYVEGLHDPIVASGESRRIAEQRAAKIFLEQVKK